MTNPNSAGRELGQIQRWMQATIMHPVGDDEELPSDWPEFLIDLATLELTFNEVFDGPGVEGEDLLNSDQLSALAPARLLQARLVGVPCLRLLPLHYPAHRYFAAVRRHE